MKVVSYQWLYLETLPADYVEEKRNPVNLNTRNYSQVSVFVKQLQQNLGTQAVQTMVPDDKYNPMELMEKLNTEIVIKDCLFESVDPVENAQGIVDDGTYLDSSCVSHYKFMLESGILGTKGNNKVRYPAQSICDGIFKVKPLFF